MPRKNSTTQHGRGDPATHTPRAGVPGAAPRQPSTGHGAHAPAAQFTHRILELKKLITKKPRRGKRQHAVGAGGAVGAGTPSPAATSPAQSEPSPQPVSYREAAHPTISDPPEQPTAQGGSLEWQAAAARKSLEVTPVSNDLSATCDAPVNASKLCVLTTAVARQGAIRRVRRRVEAAAGRRLEAYEHGELPYEDMQDLQLGGGELQPAPARPGAAQAASLQPGQGLLPSARSALYMARAQQALSGLTSTPDQGMLPVLKRCNANVSVKGPKRPPSPPRVIFTDAYNDGRAMSMHTLLVCGASGWLHQAIIACPVYSCCTALLMVQQPLLWVPRIARLYMFGAADELKLIISELTPQGPCYRVRLKWRRQRVATIPTGAPCTIPAQRYMQRWRPRTGGLPRPSEV